MTPSLIFNTENVWSVVALKCYASAIVSTTLHVRIMSFVHARPRVTICNRAATKRNQFVAIWNSVDSEQCIPFNRTTRFVPEAVKQSMETSPNRTHIALQRAMDSYLEGFQQWSNMLN